jgi:hypothetical protein
MLRRTFLALPVCALCLAAQKYSGPRPAKPDVPNLLHADTLLETEVGEAREEERKDEITYIISAAASPVRTPLASPVFLIQTDKLSPEKLEMYRMEVKNGRREVTFSRKRSKARPIRLSTQRLGENLYRIEVEESLENGEYSITPNGSNRVFCFGVY